MNWLIPSVVCLLSIASAAPLFGQTSDVAGMLRLLDDETAMVAKFDKSQLPPESKSLLTEATGLLPRASRIPISRALVANGVDEFLFVVSFADTFDDLGYVLFAKPDEWTKKDAEKLSADSELVCELVRKVIGDNVVLGHPKTIARLELSRSDHGSQAIEAAFAQSAAAPIQVVLTASPNQRRVMSELGVPRALKDMQLDTSLLTKIRWVAISVSLAEQGSVQMIVDTDDAETAQQVWEILPEIMPTALAHQSLDRIESAPEQVHAQLRITKGTLLTIVQAEVERQVLAQSMKHLREVMLQMHNHQSAYDELPFTITDDGGRPLLSWRVKVLPFLGVKEADLWRRFHTDEPWDSPHNRELIKEMPEAFRIGTSTTMEGKSNVMASAGEGRFFHGRPSKLEDVTDGLENTIMLVEGADAVAEIWTKPSDFEIDPARIDQQLGGNFTGKILISMGDGEALAVTRKEFAKQIADWLTTSSQ